MDTTQEIVEKLGKTIDLLSACVGALTDHICHPDIITIEHLKKSLTYAINPNDWDINNESTTCFQSEAEKEAWVRGIKHGYNRALFWVADYFGDETEEFFENNIGHKFEHIKE